MFYQADKEDGEAGRVGSESDMLDFIEERVASSLEKLATHSSDDAISTADGDKVCVCDVVSSAGPYLALFVE